MAALRAIVPHRVDLLSPRDVFHNGPDTNGHNIVAPDALVVSLGDDDPEADLQILPNLRARASTRYSGILVLTSDPHGQVAAAALDLGADDVAPQQISVDEIALRTDRLVARKRMSDRLRSTVREGLRAAVTDPLTGLYNRRYALPHVARIAERAKRLGRPFALMVADLDHFKQVNDQFGHAAGDAVLAEVANRFRAQLRAVDLVARIGGEEFLIAMPDTSGTTAQSAAHRLRSAVADKPFYLPKHDLPIPITVSIGVTMAIPDTSPFADGDACHMTSDMRAETLLHRADGALYEAKAHGRNQVELSRPAA
ncbi:diguanylate cyclase [Phaeobacter sp. J2-8]|nr:diguanylate cyclase [Phaeobacter sp. J2-8]MCJ7871904.1 diguanylate cyclase [Phaeobacter sp. J2-8]